MVNNHELGKMIVRINKEVLLKFFGDMITDYRTLKGFYNDLVDFKTGRIDEDDITEIIADTQFSSVIEFSRLSKLHVCANDSVNIYFFRTALVFADLSESLSILAKSYCEPTESETDDLIDKTYRVISGILFLLLNDYGCYESAEAIEAGASDVPYDEILYNHFAKATISPEQRHALCKDFVNDVVTNISEFKIRLDVFDEAPEKEEAFLAIMGPDIGAIDETELTMEMVDKLISGELTPDQLVAMCKFSVPGESDDGETDEVTVSVGDAPSTMEV